MTKPQFRALLSQGVVTRYDRLPGDVWSYEGPRPGPGWDRHDWKVRELGMVGATGVERRQVARRHWRRRGETTTQLDRSPDEVGRLSAVLLMVLATLWSWLSSGRGAQDYEEIDPALTQFGCPRTLQRWTSQLVPTESRLSRPSAPPSSNALTAERGRNLERAGAKERIFSNGAVKRLFHASQDTPRRVNQRAIHPLIQAAVMGHDAITGDLLQNQLRAHTL